MVTVKNHLGWSLRLVRGGIDICVGGVDHTFDHLRFRTTWKQCSQESCKASISDPKALKSVQKPLFYKDLRLWDVDAASSNPIALTVWKQSEHSLLWRSVRIICFLSILSYHSNKWRFYDKYRAKASNISNKQQERSTRRNNPIKYQATAPNIFGEFRYQSTRARALQQSFHPHNHPNNFSDFSWRMDKKHI